MHDQRSPLPRRRAVRRHPGIFYRPRRDGKVGPPYEIRYLDSSGARRWALVHGTLDDAEAKRAELLLRRHRGELIQPTRETLTEYAHAWLDRQDVRPRTKEIYAWALERHLLPRLGHRRLDQITVDDVGALIASMRQSGLKGWTITSALRPLSIILAHAARRGRIPLNPISQLERGERPKHDDQRPKRILTLEEMHALLAAADSEQYRCLLELLLTGGLRIGEALGLAVFDLDPPHALVQVECQLGRDGTRTPLKTEEAQRAIDIPPQLMHRLLDLVAPRGPFFNRDTFVFASRSGSGLERKVAREALKRAVKASGIGAPEPTLHDLRHSHASMLIAMDVPLVEVQRRLGHRKPDTTLRIYAHQWRYREARRSRIGEQLAPLFALHEPALPPPSAKRPRPLALPAAQGA
jgi:integrase